MTKKKYYAVWAGRTTGIFDKWAAAEASITG
jgi:viroplasmin and RNaseH domain-containing protein